MEDLLKIVLFGAAVYGTYQTGKAFFGELDNINRKGLTITGGIAAIGLGYLLLSRIDNVAVRASDLRA